MSNTVNNDAREFGLHVKQGGWRLGLLVARSAEKQEGGRNDRYALNAPDAETKVSLTKFADLSGTSVPRVSRYLDAWNRAAADGVDGIKPSDELNPGEEVDLDVESLPDWNQYYTSVTGGYNGSPERLSKISPEMAEQIVRANLDAVTAALTNVRAEAATAAAEAQRELNRQLRAATADDFDDNKTTTSNVVPIRPAVQPTTPEPTAYVHNFSQVSKLLLAADMEIENLRNQMQDERGGIFYADLTNEENYSILESAYDRLSMNVTQIGIMLAEMRTDALNQSRDRS